MRFAPHPAAVQPRWQAFAHASWAGRLDMLQAWVYRFGIYAALNFLDEPAWLALMFC